MEQILHFGLCDYGYTSGEKASTTTTFIENCVPIPAALPLKPLSIKYISEDPFILSCESTTFPPFLVQWENNDGYHQESPSHLINRRNSIYETILDMTLQPTIVQKTKPTHVLCQLKLIMCPEIQHFMKYESTNKRSC